LNDEELVMITKKRLQEIIKQSGFCVYKDDEVYSPYIEGTPLSDEIIDLIKLVVQECIDQVGHFEYGPDGEQNEFAMDVLRSHFGVE